MDDDSDESVTRMDDDSDESLTQLEMTPPPRQRMDSDPAGGRLVRGLRGRRPGGRLLDYIILLLILIIIIINNNEGGGQEAAC